jgi:hypothetical protein
MIAEQTKSIFHDIARLRWPNAVSITGEGAWAALIRCGHYPVVQLFESSAAAFVAHKQSCGPGCRNVHGFLELKKPVPAYRPKPRWNAAMQRD